MVDLKILKDTKIIGCGCSTFGGSISQRDALNALNSSFDNSIIYYDVARSYGFGTAEAIIGKFQKDKRSQLILASKFGINPPNFPFKSSVVQMLRFIKKQLPASKSIIRGTAVRALKKYPFTPLMVISSLDKSLSQIGTDYLDIFIFHEASQEEMLNDDIRYALVKEIEKGRIRKWGSNISDLSYPIAIESTTDWPDVIQHPLSLNESYMRLINSRQHINVIYSVINLYKSLYAHERNELTNLRLRYRQSINIKTDIELLFYLAFHQLESGVVLISTSNPAHIKRNIELSALCPLKTLQEDFNKIFTDFKD